MVCLPVREIIHSLKPVDYFLVQADKSWYNYSVLRRLQNLQNPGLDLAYNFKIKTNIWTLKCGAPGIGSNLTPCPTFDRDSVRIMDDMVVFVIFTSIFFKSWRWKDDNQRLCAKKRP